MKSLLPLNKGNAHITGGGLQGNVPRILPQGLTARYHSRAWAMPPIFQLIQQRGNVDQNEMYRVFNMGIGMVIICSPQDAEQVTKDLPEAKIVGEVVKQVGKARVVIE